MAETVTDVGPDDLRARIEELYRETTREDGNRGALAWFARQANVEPKTVSRWVRGEREPVGPAVALLEELERQAGLR